MTTLALYSNKGGVGKTAAAVNLAYLAAAAGKTILMVSSDMEELLGMSDRLIVLSRGRYAGSLTKPEFDQEKILAMASGVA